MDSIHCGQHPLLWLLLVVLLLAVHYMLHNPSDLSALRAGTRRAGRSLASTRRQGSAIIVKGSVLQPRKRRARQESLNNGDGVPAEACRGITERGEEGRRSKKDGLQLATGGAPVPQTEEGEYGGEVRAMEGGDGGWGQQSGGTRRGGRRGSCPAA